MSRHPPTLSSRLITGAACVVLFATVLSGCGAYTRQDFLSSANAICAGAVRSIRALSPPDLAAGSPVQRSQLLGRYLSHLVPVVRSEATHLHGLAHPAQSAGERHRLARYLTAVDRSVADFQALAAAAAHGSLRGVARVEDRLAASPVTMLADAYGLSSCGEPGATYRRPA